MLNSDDIDVADSPLCKSVSNIGNVYSGDPMTGVITGNYVHNKPESPIASDNSIGENNDVHDSTPDMFPEVKLFRKTHKQNFIIVHVNINSHRHKFAPYKKYDRDVLLTYSS